MIELIAHTIPGTDPAGPALALEVAHDLHAPAVPTPPAPAVAARSAEIAAPLPVGLGIGTVRPHRRRVPLKRLTAVHG
jgi:hypothetical protein